MMTLRGPTARALSCSETSRLNHQRGSNIDRKTLSNLLELAEGNRFTPTVIAFDYIGSAEVSPVPLQKTFEVRYLVFTCYNQLPGFSMVNSILLAVLVHELASAQT